MLAPPFSFSAFVALSLVPLAQAHPIENPVESRLPTRWFHHEDHPVHALFRRGDNGEQFEEPGSPGKFSIGNNIGARLNDQLSTRSMDGRVPGVNPERYCHASGLEGCSESCRGRWKDPPNPSIKK